MLNFFFQLSNILEERKQKYIAYGEDITLSTEQFSMLPMLYIQPLANPHGSFMFKSQVRTFWRHQGKSGMKP